MKVCNDVFEATIVRSFLHDRFLTPHKAAYKLENHLDNKIKSGYSKSSHYCVSFCLFKDRLSK